MKRAVRLMLIGLAGAVVVVPSASAQRPYIFAGGGINMPMGDFKDGAKAGWIAQAGFGVDVGTKGLWAEAEGWYGQNKFKVGTGNVKLWAAMLGVGYSFTPDKKVSPYVVASAGVLAGKGEGSTSYDKNFGYSGGAGIVYNATESAHLWLEARYLANKDVKMIPISAGVSFSLGKKK